MAAMDLDRISGGRFVLGLGTSVQSWSEGFFGMPYGKPLEHMREVVEIIRLVNAKAHTGELTAVRRQVPQARLQRAAAFSAAGPHGYPDLDRGAPRAAGQPGGGDRRRRDRPPDLVDRLADDADTARDRHRTEARRQGALRHRVQRLALRRREQRPGAGDRGREGDGRLLRAGSRSTRSTSPRTAFARKHDGYRRASRAATT